MFTLLRIIMKLLVNLSIAEGYAIKRSPWKAAFYTEIINLLPCLNLVHWKKVGYSSHQFPFLQFFPVYLSLFQFY